MSVLSRYFDRMVNQFSPLVTDFVRVVDVDEKQVERISWKEFDSAAYQKSLGVDSNWSLESLLKAGINPDMPISTGFTSRIEGENQLQSFVAESERIINENIDDNN